MKLRLDREMARFLDEAIAAARRGRHPVVTREHVLGALAGVKTLWRRLLPLPGSRRELAALVEARLEQLPTTAPYRDASTSPSLSEELRADLEAAGRGLLFSREVAVAELFDVLLEAPEIARLVDEARLDLDLLDDTIADARRIASEHGHIGVHPEHVLRVLADERWFAHALRDVGGDDEAFRLRLDDKLRSLRAARTGDEISKTLRSLITRAKIHANRLNRPPTGDIFLALALRETELASLIEDLRVDPMAFFVHVVHGDVLGPSAKSDDGLAEVTFYNDDFTTQELVRELLEDEFGLADVLALNVMMQVHQRGEAVVGVYGNADARERASVATARAREAGFPLRIEVRPVRAETD